jgi:hypothetical protein
MIVKDVELDENGQKNYIFGEDLEKQELLEMVANQAGTIHFLQTQITEALQSIDNQAPDLAWRKLLAVKERFQ